MLKIVHKFAEDQLVLTHNMENNLVFRKVSDGEVVKLEG